MRLEKQLGFVCGIKCDQCYRELDGDFIYYSIDARAVEIMNNRFLANISKLPIIFSFDVCASCIMNFSEVVRLHYLPTSIGVNCDLCGAKMRDNFTYYYLTISEVKVNMSDGTYSCGACHTNLITPAQLCKCGQSKPIKMAKLAIDDKYLQIAACQRDYDRMVENATKLRQTTR